MNLVSVFRPAVVLSFGLHVTFAMAQPAPVPAAAPASPAPAAPAPALPDAAPVTPPQAGTSELQQRVPELTALDVQSGGLTADETARRALIASVSVGQKRAELEAASARIRQTMVQFFPQLTLGASYTRLSPVAADLGQGSRAGVQRADQRALAEIRGYR